MPDYCRSKTHGGRPTMMYFDKNRLPYCPACQAAGAKKELTPGQAIELVDKYNNYVRTALGEAAGRGGRKGIVISRSELHRIDSLLCEDFKTEGLINIIPIRSERRKISVRTDWDDMLSFNTDTGEIDYPGKKGLEGEL